MSTFQHVEIGQKLVAFANAGKDSEAVSQLYAEKVVSIEG